jgi:ER lumen protein retaining receptor
MARTLDQPMLTWDDWQSASGISFKSQFLYLVVYISRYLDLLWTNPAAHVYNTFFKITFIAAQGYIIYLMMVDYKPTHDPNQDTFKVEYLLGGAAVLGFILPGNWKYVPTEVRAINNNTGFDGVS